jgi:hypothetical protein
LIIDKTMRLSVTFLCQQGKKGHVQPMASAFLVSINMEGKYLASYLVTARHNLEFAKKDLPLFLRINTTDKKYRDLPIQVSDFEQHRSSDVAVLPIKLPVGVFGTFIPISQIISTSELKQNPLNEGAELCMPALFSEFHGRDIMYPIVRTGRLALVPEEPVLAQLGPHQRQHIEAYLIECMSWGGCSGAPVFIERTIRSPRGLWGEARLLGILSGHYKVPSDEVEVGNLVKQKFNRRKRRKLRLGANDGSNSIDTPITVPLNGGIALVVPAQGILDLLMAEHIVEQRENDYASFIANHHSDQ